MDDLAVALPWLGPTPAWFAQKACADVPPRVFFPEANGDPVGQLSDTKIAKAICAGCPVRMDCLDYALDNHERYGIFGGHTETERRAIARRRHRARAFREAAAAAKAMKAGQVMERVS